MYVLEGFPFLCVKMALLMEYLIKKEVQESPQMTVEGFGYGSVSLLKPLCV